MSGSRFYSSYRICPNCRSINLYISYKESTIVRIKYILENFNWKAKMSQGGFENLGMLNEQESTVNYNVNNINKLRRLLGNTFETCGINQESSNGSTK